MQQQVFLPDAKRSRQEDQLDNPPNSRLFVSVPRACASESNLRALFGRYGNIETCHIVKDKATKESKGVAFIKYDKASSAALASESLNGVTMEGSGPQDRPMKVQIAQPRGSAPLPGQGGQGGPSKDEPPRSRLFVVVPQRDTADETLTQMFAMYGEVEHARVMRDKETHRSKGYAFVKFKLASAAAAALEGINSSQEHLPEESRLKCKIAEPQQGSRPGGVSIYPQQQQQQLGYPQAMMYGPPPQQYMVPQPQYVDQSQAQYMLPQQQTYDQYQQQMAPPQFQQPPPQTWGMAPPLQQQQQVVGGFAVGGAKRGRDQY